MRKHVLFSPSVIKTHIKGVKTCVSIIINPSEPMLNSYCLHPSALNWHGYLQRGQVPALYIFHQRATEVDDSYFMVTRPVSYVLYILYRSTSEAITQAGRAGMRNVSNRNNSVSPSVLQRRCFECCAGSYDFS